MCEASETTTARLQALRRLPRADAVSVLQQIHHILWPPGCEVDEAEWDANTPDAIARVLRFAAGEEG